MPRTVRDAKLETREARKRLSAQPKPHWRTLRPGELSLGYCRRRADGPGFWTVRSYLGTQNVPSGKSPYKIAALPGTADDYEDANGATVLSYAQAQDLALSRQRSAEGTHSGQLSVRQAISNYVAYVAAEGRPTKDTELRAAAHILPSLGEVDVTSLTATRLRRWLADLANKGRRVRTAKGQAPMHRGASDDPEEVRRRRSSANRVLTILKAALNHAFDEELVPSNRAWGRRVKPFEGVDVARQRYLGIDEAERFLNACEPDFRKLARGALETGARYSELTRLQVRDFNSDAGTLQIRQSKSAKARHIILTGEGAAFFQQMCVGRPAAATMFTRAGGDPWQKSHQSRPMAEASAAARIEPTITFHGLRHTWGSLAAMNGMPLLIIAKNLGHADTRMVERHYGHLSPGYVAESIRARAPRFKSQETTNVTPLSLRVL